MLYQLNLIELPESVKRRLVGNVQWYFVNMYLAKLQNIKNTAIYVCDCKYLTCVEPSPQSLQLFFYLSLLVKFRTVACNIRLAYLPSQDKYN